MKLERFVQVLAGLLLWGSACGEPEPEVFDPATFAGMHRTQVEASCRKTVDCSNTPEQYDGCVARTAQVLEGEPAKRLSFLTNYARCAAFDRCDFVACANGAQPTYGESQRPKVNYTCAQYFGCETLGGRAPANVTEAIEYCTAERVGMLDAFAAQRRAGFEQTFATCQAMANCEFVACHMF